MQTTLILLLISPILGFLVIPAFKNHQEKVVSGIVICICAISVFISLSLALSFVFASQNPFGCAVLSIYDSKEFHFQIELYYDSLTAVYSFITSILFFVISLFSKFYMHRESGFKRFFQHLLLFFIGLNFLILSGNFETLFLGWEIVGISSFLLISFFRNRYLPVKNAMKVLSFYRLGDIALILAVWFCHHLFHSNISFNELAPSMKQLVQLNSGGFRSTVLLVSLFFIFAASVKSAQFPFSTWLPRAMDGPTVSSALFYGSLSVHIGVFLLLRTYPIWSIALTPKIFIISIGLITAIVSSLIGSVQATVKTQIAYSSSSQIGLMFIEIALGWHTLALIHFSANALLRAYQLLVSPSIMTYLTHEVFFKYDPDKKGMYGFLPKPLFKGLYILCIKEFNMDFIWHHYVWRSFKVIGKSFHLLRTKIAQILLFILVLFGVLFYVIYPQPFLKEYEFISWIYSLLSLILILVAWTERKYSIRSWFFIAYSQVFFMLAIAQNQIFTLNQLAIYFSGLVGAFLGGWWCLSKVKEAENNNSLNTFHGHIYEHPKFSFFFLICSLTMIGFPISPSFIGFDILFSDIQLNHYFVLIISALTFIFLELAVLRIYARVFLGPHVKNYHEVSKRSS